MKANKLVTLIIENTACGYDTRFKPKKVYTKEELIKVVEKRDNIKIWFISFLSAYFIFDWLFILFKFLTKQ